MYIKWALTALTHGAVVMWTDFQLTVLHFVHIIDLTITSYVYSK